jgi:hypothetical protein
MSALTAASILESSSALTEADVGIAAPWLSVITALYDVLQQPS